MSSTEKWKAGLERRSGDSTVLCSFPRNVDDCNGNGAKDFDSGLQSPALAPLAAATLRQTAGPRDGWRLEAPFSLDKTVYKPYFRVIGITYMWQTGDEWTLANRLLLDN